MDGTTETRNSSKWIIWSRKNMPEELQKELTAKGDLICNEGISLQRPLHDRKRTRKQSQARLPAAVRKMSPCSSPKGREGRPDTRERRKLSLKQSGLQMNKKNRSRLLQNAFLLLKTSTEGINLKPEYLEYFSLDSVGSGSYG